MQTDRDFVEKTNSAFNTDNNESLIFLGFILNGNTYCININDVNQSVLCDEKEIIPLPKVKPQIKGITAVHGKTVTVINPKPLLNLECDDVLVSKLILLADINFSAAFAVDDIGSTILFSDKYKILPSDNKFIKCIFEKDEKTYRIINTDAILNAPETAVNIYD